MKKLILVLSIVVVLIAVTPAMASQKEPVGERLGWEVDEYPENTPFHMGHGWLFGTPPFEEPKGLFSFSMELDGEIIKPDFYLNYDLETGQLVRLYFFNFPEGMTGTHEFIGHYYGPCYQYFEECEFPYRSVEVNTTYQTITFTLPIPPGYFEQESYTGDCSNRPPGFICIGYPDGYSWFVEDSIQGWRDEGYWEGNLIRVAEGYQYDYYHILNTLLVKQLEK